MQLCGTFFNFLPAFALLQPRRLDAPSFFCTEAVPSTAGSNVDSLAQPFSEPDALRIRDALSVQPLERPPGQVLAQRDFPGV